MFYHNFRKSQFWWKFPKEFRICWKFSNFWIMVNIFEKSRFLVKFFENLAFVKNDRWWWLVLVKICKNFDCGQNYWKIPLLVKVFKFLDFGDIFRKNLDFGDFFRNSWFWSKSLKKNDDFCQNFRKMSLLRAFSKILILVIQKASIVVKNFEKYFRNIPIFVKILEDLNFGQK